MVPAATVRPGVQAGESAAGGLIKIGAKAVRHAKYVTFQMAEVDQSRKLSSARSIGNSAPRSNPLTIRGYSSRGASPLEALQMATLSSARILGFDELLGTVDADRLANLLVLAENPLKDISNIRSVRYVIHDGRLYEPRTSQ